MGKQGPCCHCGVTSTPLWRNGPRINLCCAMHVVPGGGQRDHLQTIPLCMHEQNLRIMKSTNIQE
ncbi:unnamed protein product [Rhodiola kirilowii]